MGAALDIAIAPIAFAESSRNLLFQVFVWSPTTVLDNFLRSDPWLGRTILRPIAEGAFIYAKWKYGLDFDQVSPERAVAATNVPVFPIHGQAHRNIPVRHSRKIAAGNHAVVLWEVPGADHCGAQGAGPGQLRAQSDRVVRTKQQEQCDQQHAVRTIVRAGPGLRVGARREPRARVRRRIPSPGQTQFPSPAIPA
jgi:pimeloyl-ACP methyl ester carboxylesterase